MGPRAGAGEIARRLTILRKAEEDLDDIFRFTIENWDMRQAIAYRDTLFGVIRGLTTRPARGRPAGAGLSLHIVKAGRHRVYYSFDDAEVRIVRVLHPAMDAPRHLS